MIIADYLLALSKISSDFYNCTSYFHLFVFNPYCFVLTHALNPCPAGIGIGVVFGCLIIGYARNPSLKQQIFSYAILGFALSEAMGLFCLMIAFLMLFAF